MRSCLGAVTLAAALLSGALPSALAAQSRGTSAIRGTVAADGGRTVSGARVLLRHEATGVEQSALTNERGAFLFLLLPPGGPYTLTVQSLGYAEARIEGFRLPVGAIEILDVVLRTEALELEGLEVDVSRAEIFDPARVGPATLVDERVIESLPILSRDLMDLAVLSPLVKTTEGGGFSVAGQNDRYNAILVDGVLNKDMFGLTAGGVPGGQAGAKLIPLDAVAQYEILVAPFDVRLSGFTGGIMNAVTRTGTNQWAVRGSAVHRNERLIGDLRLPTGTANTTGVDRSLVALSVGGPIVRDRAHVFIAGEFESRSQPPIGYNVGRDDPFLPRLSPAAADQVRDAFRESFGLDPGTPRVYALSQEIANVFARVDWRLGERHRLTVRDVFARAENDEGPNRLGFQPYGFASNAVLRTGATNTLSAQLFSDLAARTSNELTMQLQTGSDRSEPVSTWPQVGLGVISTVDEASVYRDIRFGSNFLAQDADLAQIQARLTNTLAIVRDRSTYTVGVTGAWYGIEHRYLPGASGEWVYGGIGQLLANDPDRVQWSALAEGEDPAVDFSVVEWGAFVQNEMSVRRGLTMRFGLRVDMPHVLEAPRTNFEVLDFFGFDTNHLPSGNALVSPRWGFNWQSGGTLRTQVRGGAGLFTGQLPFVWLANAFHDTGDRWATYLCEGRPAELGAAPPFDPSASAFACAGGAAPQVLRNVTVFDGDFRYPQDLKFSAVVDRELSGGISGSLGFLFNKAINQIVLQEMNLGEPAGDQGPLGGLGGADRRFFGRPRAAELPPVVLPNRLDPRYQRVLRATNEGDDVAFALTAELRGRLTERLAFQTGYTYARALDRMSLVAADMVSNYGLNPTDFDPNRPGLRPSNFDRPHKVVLSVYGAPFARLPDTELSVLYTGQSGYPFSYVYGFDLNGDGYPGPGAAFERTNDLAFVPTTSSAVQAGFATYALLEQALKRDACLAENVGRIIRRNACRSPWQNRLDVRASQTVRLGGASVRLEADLINVLNLLSDDWGQVTTVRAVTPLLDADHRPTLCAENVCAPVLRWAGASYRDEAGALRPTEPWYPLTPDSQWQLQLGARVSFGGDAR